MYTIYLVATDMFEIDVDGEKISEIEFIKLANSMQVGQYLRFEIKNQLGHSLLEESYLKFEELVTIQSFLKELLKTKIRQKKISKLEAKSIQRYLFPEKEEPMAPFSDSKIEPKKKQIVSKMKIVKKKKDKSKRKKSFEREAIMISIIILFLFFILIAVSQHFFPISHTLFDSASVIKSEFEEDLSILSPKEIGKKYPDKLDEIEDYHLEKKDFSFLKKFNDHYPTKNGTFDLAFHQRDWEKIIEIDVEDLSKERQVMLAYAFIQLKQLEEAELLNSRLKSELLTKELDQAYVNHGLSFLKQRKIDPAKKLSDSIQNEEMKKILQTYIDNAMIMIDFIKLYEKKEDEANQRIWERKLQVLGEESRHE